MSESDVLHVYRLAHALTHTGGARLPSFVRRRR
jgi:hypothetical protein